MSACAKRGCGVMASQPLTVPQHDFDGFVNTLSAEEDDLTGEAASTSKRMRMTERTRNRRGGQNANDEQNPEKKDNEKGAKKKKAKKNGNTAAGEGASNSDTRDVSNPEEPLPESKGNEASMADDKLNDFQHNPTSKTESVCTTVQKEPPEVLQAGDDAAMDISSDGEISQDKNGKKSSEINNDNVNIQHNLNLSNNNNFTLETNTNVSNQKTVIYTNTSSNVNSDNVDTVYYPDDHVGDVIVLLDTSKSEIVTNRRVKNGLYLWEKIRNFNISGIKSIKAIGVTLYKVYFDCAERANACLRNNELKNRNMRAFVPKSFMETYGVIRDVPLYLSDQYILDNIMSPCKVASVKRFFRRSADVLEPTYSVKIGFCGAELPNDIMLDYTRIKVDHFYPAVRMCRKCGRLGHTENGCRSGKRCLKCGKQGTCSPDCNILKCILCNGDDHSANQKSKCSAWEEEINIKKIMTIKKMSRKEVVETYNFQRNNKYSILEDYEDHFPLINPRKNNTPQRNRDHEVNQTLTPVPFNRVARKPRPIKKPEPVRKYNPQDFAWEGQLEGKVLERPNLNRVTLLEKTMSEFMKFMKDVFNKDQNMDGLNAVSHFDDRLKKIFRDIDRDIINSTCNTYNDESLTI